MKLGLKNHTDIAAGIQKETRITISANAVSFYAQISGVASDKIGYAMREISANAWDASRGNFELHLPTQVDPTCRWRDFGPGMSPEAMDNIWARMYESTKRSDDSAVGGWGLGRFSPFAYLISEGGAGSYSVTSYHDGMMHAYEMMLDINGSPVMRLMFSGESNEPSGMEISFGVRRNDIPAFRSKASTILWSFEPRPKIYPDLGWKEPVVTMAGENWTVYNGNTVPFIGPQVRMGCVMYPINLHLIKHSGFLNPSEAIVFDAKIGSLRVTLSREDLAYDDVTKATIEQLVAEYEESFVAKIQEAVSAASNWFSANEAFNSAMKPFGSWCMDEVRKRVSWNGYKLSHWIDKNDIKMMRLGEGWSSFEKFSSESVLSTWPADATIVIEHNPSYSAQRFALADLVGKKLLWIRCKRECRTEVLAAMGNPDVVDLDDYKITPAERAKRTIRKRRTLLVNSVGNLWRETVDIDMAEGGLYVETSPSLRRWGTYGQEWFRVASGRQQMNFSAIDDVVETCVQLGLIAKETRILISNADVKLADNWELLGDNLIPRLTALVDKTQFSALHGRKLTDMERDLRLFSECNADGLPSDLKALHQKASEMAASLRIIENGSFVPTPSDRAADALVRLGENNLRNDVPSPTAALNQEWAVMKRRYPLLRAVMSSTAYGYGSRVEAQPMLSHYASLLADRTKLQLLKSASDGQVKEAA